ncbi:hypothetical protein Tco_0570623 [Tanacetum coccineum]
MKRENHSKEIKTTKMAKAKENALSVVIQIISLENVQNYQDIKTKSICGDLGVISRQDEDEKPQIRKVPSAKASKRSFPPKPNTLVMTQSALDKRT